MNGNRRVYIKNEQAKLSVNQSLFQEMMEAGSYFLHLREFVDCMQNSEQAGKMLQAFSLAIADFLTYYQSQIIEF